MTALADAIKKVATGPHLSKDLTEQEAFDVMMEILSGNADPVRAAIFFIAMRMKRETNEENLGILRACQSMTMCQSVDVDQLFIFSDPFNGFNRHCPMTAFLPAVLAACDLPTMSQGVFEMGPKFGVTHAQVLSLAGYNIEKSTAEAADAVMNNQIGWAYLDQAQASPALFALQTLRTQMIKRPSLATLEKMIMPLKAKKQTHLGIGFVHKEYPDILGWLAEAFGYNSAFIARGLEGGLVPTLREPSNNHRLLNGKLQACTLDPEEFGIEQDTRGVKTDDDVTAQRTLDEGQQALSGVKGPAYDSLVYGAAIILWHCGVMVSQREAADYVRSIIDNGKAKMHFEAGLG
ncbi:anthranilate phosphoribosyltransferase [Methylophaga thalassica]|uniref:Anthranilate phosphoribosyltransferase n=2 Tax=Methylophaga thalassica TaxID=40223 RepID=A0ABQ5TV54_9GAMM|nr:glycosyl transferase [Methylophaga thalassica]GLP99312.1 anthranilate phosphoribosyltransferase [Methylophaga thalassica]